MENLTNSSSAGKSAGLAGLIVGLVALLISIIPCLGMWGAVPAIAGIILSAISMSQAGKEGASKGLATGGLICSIVAFLIAAYWIYVWMFVANAASSEILNSINKMGVLDSLNKAMEQLKQLPDTIQWQEVPETN